MKRLAWFTPLPPVRSGIAAYSAELLPRLLQGTGDAGAPPTGYAIDVFVDAGPPGTQSPLPPAPAPGCAVLSAHDFLWKANRTPYDLVVYQLGNAACHDYMWPYLVRYPGLAVLHDAQLHHARAGHLLHRRRFDDYRAEFGCNHPDAPPGIAEYAIAGFGGTLYYLWPMRRLAVTSAGTVAVHSRLLARDLREEFPEATIERITMGVPARASGAGRASGDGGNAVRARYGIRAESILFAAFGLVTPEKRISHVIAALGWLARSGLDVHLLLVGDTARHYDSRADGEAHGVADRVTVTGFVDDETLAGYLDAVDACVNMRWPSSRETSASWLRCLAAGKPTIITDLVHSVDVPSLDPRTWTSSGGGEAAAPPVCVSVDILDEDHSLRLAMQRLATDPAFRAQLGAAAREYWQQEHTLERMTADYRRTLNAAVARPARKTALLPDHMHDDGEVLMKRLLAEMHTNPPAW